MHVHMFGSLAQVAKCATDTGAYQVWATLENVYLHFHLTVTDR